MGGQKKEQKAWVGWVVYVRVFGGIDVPEIFVGREAMLDPDPDTVGSRVLLPSSSARMTNYSHHSIRSLAQFNPQPYFVASKKVKTNVNGHFPDSSQNGYFVRVAVRQDIGSQDKAPGILRGRAQIHSLEQIVSTTVMIRP
jgi:hypothetical protein